MFLPPVTLFVGRWVFVFAFSVQCKSVSRTLHMSLSPFFSQVLHIVCNTYLSQAFTFRHVCFSRNDAGAKLKLLFIPGVVHCSIILQSALRRPDYRWNGLYLLKKTHWISEVRSSWTSPILCLHRLSLEQTPCWTSSRFILSIAAHLTCEPICPLASAFSSNNCAIMQSVFHHFRHSGMFMLTDCVLLSITDCHFKWSSPCIKIL